MTPAGFLSSLGIGHDVLFVLDAVLTVFPFMVFAFGVAVMVGKARKQGK